MRATVRVLAAAVVVAGMALGLVVTVLRLTQPELAATPLLVGFAPLLVPAYAVALLLALAPWPLRGRPWRAGVVALAVAALALHVAWLLPTYAARSAYDPRARDGAAVRAVSVNVLKGRADPAALRRLLRRLDPQVLVLAEVSGDFERALEAGEVTDLPRVAGRGHSGTRVYSSLPTAGPAVEVPDGGVGWRVPLRVGGRVVQVYGVHPTAPHISTAGWWADWHRLARLTARRPGPALVVGDLNATLDHAPVIGLQQAGFADAARTAGLGWAPTWPTNGRPVPLRVLALDHVLARGPWTLTGVERHDVRGSDHQAFVATWRLRR